MKHYIILIDVSGSVQTFFYKVVDALNNFIRNKKYTEKCFITVCSFSSTIKFITTMQHIDNITSYSLSDFTIDGLTALYDSIGNIINGFKNNQKQNILIILTDGDDNYSFKYKKHEIDKLCDEMTKFYNWTFIQYHTDNVLDILNTSKSIVFNTTDDLSNIFNNLSI